MSRQQGFTLLEVLAAIAIFAVVAVMAYGGLNAVIWTRGGLEASYDRIERWQRGTRRLREDIELARPRGVRDEFGDRQPALWLPEDGRLELTRGGLRNPLLLPRSTLERVAYYLKEDRLVRASWPVLDRAQGADPRELTLLEGIETLSWRFLAPSVGEQANWLDRWPEESLLGDAGGATTDLPQAVELEMETRDFGQVRLLFALVAP